MKNKNTMNKLVFKGDCKYIDIHHNKTVNLDANNNVVKIENSSPSCSAELMDQISFINGTND